MIKRIIIGIMLVLFALTSVAGVAMAAETNQESHVVLPAGEVHKGLYAKAGDSVTIDGEVDGDVWVAGTTVTVNGVVNGNVFAAGGSVNIKGKVAGSVFAAGGTVTFDSEIGGSGYAASSNTLITDHTKIRSSMVNFGSEYVQSGVVGQQAYLFGSKIQIFGIIGGNTKIYASDIIIYKDAKLLGNLEYVSDANVNIQNDKNISGSITKIEDTAEKASQPTVASIIFGVLFGLLSSLIIGLVVFGILPGSARATIVWEQQNMLKALLMGLGFAFLVPVVLIVLAITFVGLPLALIGLMTYMIVLLLGEVVTGYCIGHWLLKNDRNTLGTLALQLLIGIGVLKLIGIVPIVGGIVVFFAAIMGIGALVGRGKQRLQAMRKQQLAKV